MLKLSAFADEISPELREQVRACNVLGITHLELRSVENVNVLDFDAKLRKRIKSALADAGLAVISIGSPIGKVKINEPWDKYFDRFKIAVESAEYFGAPLIRIFSYYPRDKGDDIKSHRDEVMRRMNAKVEYLAAHP